MKKIILAVIAASVAAAAVPAVLAAEEFNDVNSSHWAYEYIDTMAQQGIIDGYDDGTFMPERKVTRAEFAAMLVRAARLSGHSDAAVFSDVAEDAWYKYYVNLASPYLVGSNDKFAPEEEASRADVAAAIVRLLDYDTEEADTAALEERFSDAAGLDDETERYIALAFENGIMDGFDEGVFLPNDSITRAQAAAILVRSLDNTVVVQAGDEKVYYADITNLMFDIYGFDDPDYKLALANDIATVLAAGQVARARGIELDDENRAYVGEVKALGSDVSPKVIERIYAGICYREKLYDQYNEEYTADDSETEKYFNENFYRAKHILVEDEKLANDLLQKARNGEDFDKLMAENTLDPGSAYYPDGYIFGDGEMVQEFEDCVKNTEIGGYGLCKSDYGYHVISRLPLTWDAAGYEDQRSYIENMLAENYTLRRFFEDVNAYGIEITVYTDSAASVG